MEDVKNMDAVILAVGHNEFINLKPNEIKSMFKEDDNGSPVLFDLKGILDRKQYEGLGYNYWRL